jgi:hypothetical protein
MSVRLNTGLRAWRKRKDVENRLEAGRRGELCVCERHFDAPIGRWRARYEVNNSKLYSVKIRRGVRT